MIDLIEKRRCQREIASGLVIYSWDDFVTITFRCKSTGSPRNARGSLAAGSYFQKTFDPLMSFWSAEPFSDGEGWHLHGLVKYRAEKHWSKEEIEDRCNDRFGLSTIEPVKNNGGVGFYVAKFSWSGEYSFLGDPGSWSIADLN